MKLVILIFFLFSQYPPDTNYTPIYTPIPPMPSLNQPIVDTTTQVLITRITDYDSVWDWYPRHAYSKTQTWNADMSMYKFYSVAIYSSLTHEKIMDLPDIYYSLWSNTDPDLLYSFRSDGVIQTYRISTHELDTLFRLRGFDLVKVGPGEGNIDNYDRYVALACKKDTDLVVVIFDLQLGDTLISKLFQGAWGNDESPYYFDWISISQSGDYVGIMWDHNHTSPENPFNGHFGVEIYDSRTLTFSRRLVEYGNHGDFGFTPGGEEVFVQFYGHGGTINAYKLGNGEHIIIHNHPDFGFGDAHISCRNIRRPGWAYASTDPSKGGMIVAVKLDGSGTVELFGHHFSSAYNYTKSPMPVPSPDGTIVMFNSDFGDSVNTELVYVFTSQYSPSVIEENPESSNNNIFYGDKKIFINVPNNQQITLDILTIDGRKIRKMLLSGQNHYVIPLNFIQSGIYFSLIKQREHIFTKKFIILK